MKGVVLLMIVVFVVVVVWGQNDGGFYVRKQGRGLPDGYGRRRVYDSENPIFHRRRHQHSSMRTKEAEAS